MNPTHTRHTRPPVPRRRDKDFTAGACTCTRRLHTFGAPECTDAAKGKR